MGGISGVIKREKIFGLEHKYKILGMIMVDNSIIVNVETP